MKNNIVLVDLLAYTEKKGGTDVYIKNLYKHISGLDFNFNFLGFASHESKKLDMSWFPGEIFYSSIKSENKLSWSIGEIISLPRFARRIKPVLIHCPANFGPFYTSFPTLLTVHDSLYWSNSDLAPNGLLVPAVRFLQKFAVHNAKKIITSTKYSAKEISKIHGVDLADISVVYLAATENSCSDPVKISYSNYLLAGGNRFKHKNWEGLLKGLKLIDSSIRPKTIITGGRSPDPLVELVNSMGLEKDVVLLDWVPEAEMNSLYFNSMAVIVPSHTESYLPMLQALNFGKPLLISEIPPHKEIAGEKAFYFDSNSPNSIAQAILSYLKVSKTNLRETRKELSVKDNYSWKNTAIQTLSVMESIIG